jgi:hypothetical protein
MEISQGNSLDSYPKETKMSFYFYFTKITEQETGTVLSRGGWYQWEEVGNECTEVNMVQILCTHACKWKNDTC